jgi:hypothetical protein
MKIKTKYVSKILIGEAIVTASFFCQSPIRFKAEVV